MSVLNPDSVEDCLESFPIYKYDAFIANLYRVLPEACSANAAPYVLSLRLIRELYDFRGGQYHAFVLLKTTFRAGSDPSKGIEATIDRELIMIAGGDSDPAPIPQRKSWSRNRAIKEPEPEIPDRTEIDDSPLAYHDYAGAKRLLCSTLPACNCKPIPTFSGKHAYCECDTYDERLDPTVCKQENLTRLIELFQRRGYGEVRYNTLLAVNGRLPAELLEEIFEYTMAAEELPLNPRIFKNFRFQRVRALSLGDTTRKLDMIIGPRVQRKDSSAAMSSANGAQSDN